MILNLQKILNGQVSSKLISRAGLLGFVALLSACSTYSKDECINMSWYHVAYEQGFRGYPSLQKVYNTYAKTCGQDHNVFPDKAEMEKGYKEGLKNYCTEEGGLRAGSSGHTYADVCGPATAPNFMKTYQPARLSYLEAENVRLQKQIAELKEDISDLKSEKEKLEDELRQEKNKKPNCR